MKKIFFGIILLLAFMYVSTGFASDYTKSAGAVKLDWTLLDDTDSDAPFTTTGAVTCADDMQVMLHIDVAHLDANTPGTVTVAIWVRAGATDESWHRLDSYTCGTTTATKEDLATVSGNGQANEDRIEVADTSDWDTGDEEVLFLYDTGSLTNSCLVVVSGWADDDYYVVDHDLINGYDTADDLLDDVNMTTVLLPAGVCAYKVNFHNNDEDATYGVRVEETKVTDLE
jgi:hypothetical protein